MIDFPAIHIGNVTFDEIPQHGTIGEGYQKIYPKSKMQGHFFARRKFRKSLAMLKLLVRVLVLDQQIWAGESVW